MATQAPTLTTVRCAVCDARYTERRATALVEVLPSSALSTGDVPPDPSCGRPRPMNPAIARIDPRARAALDLQALGLLVHVLHRTSAERVEMVGARPERLPAARTSYRSGVVTWVRCWRNQRRRPDGSLDPESGELAVQCRGCRRQHTIPMATMLEMARSYNAVAWSAPGGVLTTRPHH